MKLDRELAGRLVELEPAAALGELRGRGLLTPDGLDALLAEAGATMRDDPAVGTALAELARAVAGEARAPLVVPRASYLLAQARAAAGDLTGGLALVDEARTGFDALDAPMEALRTNLGRSQLLNEMGRHDDARRACAEILDHAADRSDDDPALAELVAAAHQNSGLCAELSGRFADALHHYREAERGYARLGAVRALAEVRYDRALVHLTLGRHAEALDALVQSAAEFRRGGFRSLLVLALTNIAEVRLLRGEYQACLDALAEARVTSAGISAPVGEHVQLLVSARAYVALNLLPEALSAYRQAIAFLDGRELVIEQARARWGHGLALARTGDHAAADRALAEAADRFERSGQSSWLAEVLVDRALVALAAGRPEAAAALAADARARAAPGTVARLRAELLLAEAAPPDERITRLHDVARAADVLGLGPLRVATRHALGRAWLDRAEFDVAERELNRAVAEVEELRDGLDQELTRTRFLDDKLSPYEDLLALHVQRGDADAVLTTSERARSRTLAEIVRGLRHGRSDIQPSDRAPSDRAPSDPTDGAAADDLRAVYAELFSGEHVPGSDRHERLRTRMAELEAELERRRIESGARQPSTRGTAGSDGHPAAALAADVDAVISYSRAGDELHAVVLDGSGRTLVPAIASLAHVLDLLAQLQRQWDRFRVGADALVRHLPQLERAAQRVLAEAHRALLAPVLARCPAAGAAGARVVVVPDGLLHEVPFHALHDGTAYVGSRLVVSYAPSIDVLRHLPARLVGGRSVVAGAADARAPRVDAEVASVARGLPRAQAWSGAAATWDAVAPALPGAAHVHLAGHAVFRPDNPMYSVLRFADRWVTAAELLTLDVRGATVVLGACDSARSGTALPAEVNGFVRAFLGAGAATVIASQWPADDAATVRFMELLYARLGRKEGPATAVRGAQRDLAAERPHPYFWAPFVVVGQR